MSKIRKNKLIITACLLIVVLSVSMILFTGCTNSKYDQLLNFLKTNGVKDSEKDDEFGYQYTYRIDSKVDMYYYTGSEYNDEISFSLNGYGADPHVTIDINKNLRAPYTWSAMYVISGQIIFVRGTLDPSDVRPGSTKGITVDNIEDCPYGYETTLTTESIVGARDLLAFMHVFFTYNESVPVSMVDLGFVNFT